MALAIPVGTDVPIPPLDGVTKDPLTVNYYTQRMTNWCWAACIQMICNFFDPPITQCNIVDQYRRVVDYSPDPTVDYPCQSPPKSASPDADETCSMDTPEAVYNCFHLSCSAHNKRYYPGKLPNYADIIRSQRDRGIPIHCHTYYHARIIAGYVGDPKQVTQIYILDPDPSKGQGWVNFDNSDIVTVFYDFKKNPDVKCPERKSD